MTLHAYLTRTPSRSIANIDPRLYDSLIEHLRRVVYKDSYKTGFRKDGMRLHAVDRACLDSGKMNGVRPSLSRNVVRLSR